MKARGTTKALAKQVPKNDRTFRYGSMPCGHDALADSSWSLCVTTGDWMTWQPDWADPMSRIFI